MAAARVWATAIARRCSGKALKPKWADLCEQHIFPVFQSIRPCLPLYTQILKAVKQEDFKPRGLIVNPEAQAKLGEFYLCCACALRPHEIETAGDDGDKLMKLARHTAEAEVEPWIAAVREFVDDFDPSVAQKLENAAELKISDESNFWRLNFEAAAPDKFARFVAEAEEQRGPSREEHGGTLIPEGLTQLADEVYNDWLNATAQPIKGEIRGALARCGLLVTKEEVEGGPQKPKSQTLDENS